MRRAASSCISSGEGAAGAPPPKMLNDRPREPKKPPPRSCDTFVFVKGENGVDCRYEPISVSTARWVEANSERELEAFERKAYDNLARDGADHLTYLAPTRVNLQLAQERHPDIRFRETREI